MYWLKGINKDESKLKLNIYGVSSKDLSIYCTSDKDMIRRINRLPGPDFLLNNIEDDKTDKMDSNDLEDNEFDFDEFVLVDREQINEQLGLHVSQDQLDHEELVKNETESVLLHGEVVENK